MRGVGGGEGAIANDPRSNRESKEFTQITTDENDQHRNTVNHGHDTLLDARAKFCTRREQGQIRSFAVFAGARRFHSRAEDPERSRRVSGVDRRPPDSQPPRSTHTSPSQPP